jgi:PilZ domain-containing protein
MALMIKRKQMSVDKPNWHSSQADRRASRRFPVGWDITIRRVGRNGKVYNEIGDLNNLSSSGIHVNLARLAKIGDKLEVYIKIPMKKKHWMKYSGEIVRLQSNDSGVGIGIKFDKLRPEFTTNGLVQD